MSIVNKQSRELLYRFMATRGPPPLPRARLYSRALVSTMTTIFRSFRIGLNRITVWIHIYHVELRHHTPATHTHPTISARRGVRQLREGARAARTSTAWVNCQWVNCPCRSSHVYHSNRSAAYLSMGERWPRGGATILRCNSTLPFIHSFYAVILRCHRLSSAAIPTGFTYQS